ncbi:MAG: hypothetical protein RL701_2211 [Pseudomonadota bacterium]
MKTIIRELRPTARVDERVATLHDAATSIWRNGLQGLLHSERRFALARRATLRLAQPSAAPPEQHTLVSPLPVARVPERCTGSPKTLPVLVASLALIATGSLLWHQSWHLSATRVSATEPNLAQLPVPAPSVPVATAHATPSMLERAAVAAWVAGDYALASSIYAALAAANPSVVTFGLAARTLEQRAKQP